MRGPRLGVHPSAPWRRLGQAEAMCKLAGAVAALTKAPKSVAVSIMFGHLSIALQRAPGRHWVWGWRSAGVPLANSAGGEATAADFP